MTEEEYTALGAFMSAKGRSELQHAREQVAAQAERERAARWEAARELSLDFAAFVRRLGSPAMGITDPVTGAWVYAGSYEYLHLTVHPSAAQQVGGWAVLEAELEAGNVARARQMDAEPPSARVQRILARLNRPAEQDPGPMTLDGGDAA